MTLLATFISALMSLVSLTGAVDYGFVTKDKDVRDKNNQEAFHEEDMFSAGQMGHCPRG